MSAVHDSMMRKGSDQRRRRWSGTNSGSAQENGLLQRVDSASTKHDPGITILKPRNPHRLSPLSPPS
jgi:hypothetical protein